MFGQCFRSLIWQEPSHFLRRVKVSQFVFLSFQEREVRRPTLGLLGQRATVWAETRAPRWPRHCRGWPGWASSWERERGRESHYLLWTERATRIYWAQKHNQLCLEFVVRSKLFPWAPPTSPRTVVWGPEGAIPPPTMTGTSGSGRQHSSSSRRDLSSRHHARTLMRRQNEI